MREILFRGKRIDNGEWVEGWYYKRIVHLNTFHQNVVVDAIKVYDGENPLSIAYYSVDPETVGQYTGLTDKNGKKIFEGDVLRIAQTATGMGDYYYPPIEYPVKVVVRWDLCAWMWETLCEDKRYISFPSAWCHYGCEVIGNIHDNPELLKGGDD